MPNFLRKITPNLRILLDKLFCKTNYSPDNAKMVFNQVVFDKPANLVQMNPQSQPEPDVFTPNFNYLSKGEDDYFKYLRSLKTPKNMIRNDQLNIEKPENASSDLGNPLNSFFQEDSKNKGLNNCRELV